MDKLIRVKHGEAEALDGNIIVKHLKKAYPENKVVVETRPHRFACYPAADELVDMARFDLHDSYEVHNLILREPCEATKKHPSTKAARCLSEEFGLWPHEDLFTYEVEPSDEAVEKVSYYIENELDNQPYVVCHFEGSGVEWSDLEYDEQFELLMKLSEHYVPVLLNWREAPFAEVPTPKGDHWLWDRRGKHPDMGIVYELIRQSQAFWGIDSWPAKLAGATDVPAHVLHFGTHPIHSFVPCNNVVHHIPEWHRNLIYPDIHDGEEYLEKYRTLIYGDRLEDHIESISVVDEPVDVTLNFNVNVNGQPIDTEEFIIL